MKRFLLLCVAACTLSASFAQTDSTGKKEQKTDTIRIGGILIVRKPGTKDREVITHDKNITIPKRRYGRQENVTTNWWIVDIGFANVNEKTNYSLATSSGFVDANIGKDQMKLRAGKSRNVNLWFFMQRLNMIEHVVNLKYGLGLELNNYYFDDERIRFHKNPTMITMDPALEGARKNKLAADYLTVPLMINFNFTPQRFNSFGVSAGVSAGYLYSARQKTKIGGNKDKLKNDLDLKRWKVSYVAELLLGPVKLYGSYAAKNMWDKGLDQTPYTVGFRLSNW